MSSVAPVEMAECSGEHTPDEWVIAALVGLRGPAMTRIRNLDADVVGPRKFLAIAALLHEGNGATAIDDLLRRTLGIART